MSYFHFVHSTTKVLFKLSLLLKTWESHNKIKQTLSLYISMNFKTE